MSEPINIISLGAGVQSSTMALMAAHGEIGPMPDCAIFSDVGAEPQAVYDYLDYLEPILPFPVYRVMQNDGLLAEIEASTLNGKRFAAAPFYSAAPDGSLGLLRRQCTREFKIEPITRKIRELVGLKKGQRAPRGAHLATQWIGISLDEIQRMKDTTPAWARSRWPLIEERLTRGHCLEWMERNGYTRPPRSACTFCPYRTNEQWRELKENDPEAWQQALGVDELIRTVKDTRPDGATHQLYVHRSGVPLAEADLTDPHKDQAVFSFMDECDGMCGV